MDDGVMDDLVMMMMTMMPVLVAGRGDGAGRDAGERDGDQYLGGELMDTHVDSSKVMGDLVRRHVHNARLRPAVDTRGRKYRSPWIDGGAASPVGRPGACRLDPGATRSLRTGSFMFNALYLEKNDANATVAQVHSLDDATLPTFDSGGVTVAVDYSTINYKDGLAITGKSPVVRKFPMVPGIDFAGTVLDSADEHWKAGDRVILNGWGVGESHWGGLAQRARVSGAWLVGLPESMEPFDAMAIGTAGYTAMLSVLALQRHGVSAGDGEVLVTGATGGVGSFSVTLLKTLGYRVVASTGKASEAPFLEALGAAEVIDRATLAAPGKPLQKERWAGVVDTVGSHTLANACASTRYGGTVTACGLAQGMDFPVTVAPFILRAVRLIGIDSVMASSVIRTEAWSRLAELLDREAIRKIARTVSLAESIDVALQILAGSIRGRVVVDVNR